MTIPLHKFVSLGGIKLSEGPAHCGHPPWITRFLGQLVATGITLTKELRWLGFGADLFIGLHLVPKPQKLVDYL